MKSCMHILPVLIMLCMICMPVAAAQLNDTTKVIVVSFRYTDGTVTPEGSRVIYGHPPDYVANRDLVAELADKSGSAIGSYGIEDPRILYSDEGAILESDVKFSVFLPYDASGNHVDILDGSTGQKLASADITGPMATFCTAHGDDPDCGGGGSPVLLYGAVVLVILVIIGGGAYLMRKNRSGGAT